MSSKITFKKFKQRAISTNSYMDKVSVEFLIDQGFTNKDKEDISDILVGMYKVIFTNDINRILHTFKEEFNELTKEEIEIAVDFLSENYYRVFFSDKKSSGDSLIYTLIDSLRDCKDDLSVNHICPYFL